MKYYISLSLPFYLNVRTMHSSAIFTLQYIKGDAEQQVTAAQVSAALVTLKLVTKKLVTTSSY